MKTIHLWTLILVNALLFSCKNTEKSTPKVEKSAQNVISSSEIPKEMVGQWINQEWLNAVKSGKTLPGSQMRASISSVQMEPSGGVILGYNWHEGDFGMAQKVGNTIEIRDTSAPEKRLKYVATIENGQLLLKSEGEIVKFAAFGDQNYETFLVAGDYKLASSNALVSLKKDGTVSGLDSYKNYKVLLDYTGDDSKFDQILLLKKPDDFGQSFAFQKKNGGLLLFSTQCILKKQDPCMALKKDKLQFELLPAGN